MDIFSGRCVGGPDDGKMMTHWAKAKKFYSPMFPMTLSTDPPVVPVEIGEYRLNDFEQWHWCPTEAGKALDQLRQVAP